MLCHWLTTLLTDEWLWMIARLAINSKWPYMTTHPINSEKYSHMKLKRKLIFEVLAYQLILHIPEYCPLAHIPHGWRMCIAHCDFFGENGMFSTVPRWVIFPADWAGIDYSWVVAMCTRKHKKNTISWKQAFGEKRIWHFTGGDLKCFTSSEFVCDYISRFHAIISCWRKNEMQKNSRNLYRVMRKCVLGNTASSITWFRWFGWNNIHKCVTRCSVAVLRHTHKPRFNLSFFPHSSRARVTQRPISSNGVYVWLCAVLCARSSCVPKRYNAMFGFPFRIVFHIMLVCSTASRTHTHTYTHSEHESFCCRLSVCWRCLFLNVVVPSFVYIFMNEKHSVVINIK